MDEKLLPPYKPVKHYLDKARRGAFKNGHLLKRFEQGKDSDGKPDPWTYGTYCQFCSQIVLVFHDDDKCEWIISGPPLTKRCKAVR